MSEAIIPGFRRVPRTGVIYVMNRARKLGYRYEDPEWANLGQGMPETGSLPGAPPRIESITIDLKDRHVIVVEDIVDTGTSMEYYLDQLQDRGPASVRLASRVNLTKVVWLSVSP